MVSHALTRTSLRVQPAWRNNILTSVPGTSRVKVISTELKYSRHYLKSGNNGLGHGKVSSGEQLYTREKLISFIETCAQIWGPGRPVYAVLCVCGPNSTKAAVVSLWEALVSTLSSSLFCNNLADWLKYTKHHGYLTHSTVPIKYMLHQVQAEHTAVRVTVCIIIAKALPFADDPALPPEPSISLFKSVWAESKIPRK